MKRILLRSTFFIPAVIAGSVWILAHFASLDFKLFFGHILSTCVAAEQGNFHFDAFFVATESIEFLDAKQSFIRYEDSMRDLPAPTLAKTLFSTELGGFVEDTGDGYDIAFWLPWWFIFLISLIPIVYLARHQRTEQDDAGKPNPAAS